MHQPHPPTDQAQLLAGVLDSSLDGIYAFESERDHQGQIVDFTFVVVNRAAEQLVGRTADQLLGQRMLEMLPGNKTDGLFDAYVKVVETGMPFVTEHYYEHDGLATWFRISASKCGDGFTVSFSDITEDKRANDRFRVLFERSTNAHLLFDESGIIDCNQAAIDMLGYENKAEVLNLHPAELSPQFQPDGRRSMEKCIEMDRTAHENGFHRFDWMHRRKDGSDIPVEVTLNPVKLSGKDALLVVWHDLTERVESERKLRLAAETLNEAQTLANLGSWQWTPADNRIVWSDQTKRIFGIPLDQPAPDFEAHEKQIHPDDLDHWRRVVERAMQDHRPYVMKFRAVLPDGSIRHIEGRGQSELDDLGRVQRMFGTCHDITEQERSREELALANERLELMVAGNASGIWDWDCQSGDLYWSPRFKELLGYDENEIEPRYEDFESRLHPQDRQRTIDRLDRHIHKKRPYDVEFRIRRKNGTYIWCHAAGQAQWDASGKPIRMAGSIADISNRKADQAELIDQQHRLEIALNATSTGLWDWDTQSGETYFSDSWYTMLGYEPGEMPMHVQSWMDITEPNDLEHANAALDNYFKGKTDRYACEIRVRNKAGEWRWVLDMGEAIERDTAGNVTRMIGLHVDIHEQKLAQFQLEQARDTAQQASAAKSAFVANMSHEIRTPMNAILGYADLLLDTDQTEADKRNHAQTIRRNGKHLLNILNDVLDISKIEAGKMSVEHIECSPDQVFADAIALMMPKAFQKGIDLELEADGELPERIMTDPTRLQQVLHNLVGNAIKFTDSGSVRVVVRSKLLEQDQALLTCDVIDTGIGIHPGQLTNLFEPFQQADDSTTRRYGGSGLGLTISSNLCKLLGGELTCVSTPGEGSTFTASLSVGVVDQAQAKQANDHPATDNSDRLIGRRVLVVEDAVDNQRLVNHYLTKSGCVVEIAENGELGRDAAMQAVRRGKPFDIVLMDMQMPVLDGYNATQQLRAAGYDLPIIALTAHASASDREACIDAGCTDYLSKPIARQDLVHMIAGHLDSRQREGAEA